MALFLPQERVLQKPQRSAISRFNPRRLVASLWQITPVEDVSGLSLLSIAPPIWRRTAIRGLSRCVSIGYTRHMVAKDAGLRIRIDRDLRDAFLKVCRAQDKPAAQVIREFMRDYISHASQGEALNV